METGKIKKFATEARNILMQGVRQRLQALGFDLKTGRPSEMPLQMEGGAVFMGDVVSTDFYCRWMSLYNNVQRRSIKDVAEEAAYTWFNRFMAIRIMAKQEFIAPVLKYESDDVRVPVIVSEARQGRMPEMSESDRDKLFELLDDDSCTSEQFAMLIVAYCHDNAIINGCFGHISDYTELLLPQNILSDGGFVDMLNHTDFISDEQYASAELIGWLYQFYISDRKDEAFAKKGKYEPDEIAAATQIFTPNWIVKYMVENTLGRIYIDNNPSCDLKDDLRYLVDVQSSAESLKINDLAEMKVADLACGSGHILNECFDILYKIYVEEGYSRQQAIHDIFRKNILGIDLDTRAKQLATFALLMKACQKDKSFLDGKVMPRIYDMPRPIAEVIPADWGTDDPKEFLRNSIPHYLLGGNDNMTREITDAILLMNDADTLGSIMKFGISDSTRNAIMVRTQEYEEQMVNDEVVPDTIKLFIPYMNIILALTEKYAAICMNPPYMAAKHMDDVLSSYVSTNYPRSKNDLFSVFMDVAYDRILVNAKYGMINMQVWMYNKYFTALRENLLSEQQIDSLLHLGPHTFDELNGEIVQNVSFVISRHTPTCGGTFVKLVDGENCSGKEHMFLSHSDKYVYKNVNQNRFSKIRLCPMGSYWASDQILKLFEENSIISDNTEVFQGLSTAANTRFIRFWHEVDMNNFDSLCPSRTDSIRNNKKWYPCNKGGGQRKWYGNHYEVIDWSNDGFNIRQHEGAVIRADECHFKPTVTWNKISGSYLTFRYYPEGFVLESASNAIPCKNVESMIGLLSTKLTLTIAQILNATTNLSNGVVARFPYLTIEDDILLEKIRNNITISKQDWDAHETSWNYEENVLMQSKSSCDYRCADLHDVNNQEKLSVNGNLRAYCKLLSDSYEAYKIKWERMFMQLHENEEELNRKFIEIYGLQDELTPDVPLDEITILQQGEISIVNNEIVWHDDVVMKQLISYAVGCMMGRYSIDKPGLILANQGDGLREYEALVPNSRFEIDDDGIIPLMSSNTEFVDCATKRFKTWLSVTFGEQTLIDNLNFIEASIGKSIDDYFVKDFWKDHKKMYQNRPIYWLFSSNKGAFQCLVYMHRMNPYTAEAIRTKYLLPHIEWLVNKQKDMVSNMMNLSTRERKELDSITAQIAECREYHDRLHVIADQQIAFDLDDGVVVNYAKFGDVLQKLK